MPFSIYVFREIRPIVSRVHISSLNGNVCVFFIYYCSNYRAFYTGYIHKNLPSICEFIWNEHSKIHTLLMG